MAMKAEKLTFYGLKELGEIKTAYHFKISQNAKSNYDQALANYQSAYWNLVKNYANENLKADLDSPGWKNLKDMVKDINAQRLRDLEALDLLDTVETFETAVQNFDDASNRLQEILNDPEKNPNYEQDKESKPSELEYEHNYEE
jgi:hypothetical protein